MPRRALSIEEKRHENEKEVESGLQTQLHWRRNESSIGFESDNDGRSKGIFIDIITRWHQQSLTLLPAGKHMLSKINVCGRAEGQSSKRLHSNA
jgi:hypothetical protein